MDLSSKVIAENLLPSLLGGEVLPCYQKPMAALPGIARRNLLRFSNGTSTAVVDVLAQEEPLNLQLRTGQQSRSVAITMRTPGADTDLALGFLFTEGILTEWSEVTTVEEGKATDSDSRNTVTVVLEANASIDWARLERHGYTSSSCGVCGKTSLEQVYTALPFGDLPGHWQVPTGMIPQLPPLLREAQTLFAQTGGIHAAGLFDREGQLLHFAEDVGRHNALDKLIGHYFQLEALPLRERMLVLSGRASFELIQKAAMAGISFVVAVGAPSSLAAELAEEMGMTLCGFTRGDSFNCYSGAERIAEWKFEN